MAKRILHIDVARVRTVLREYCGMIGDEDDMFSKDGEDVLQAKRILRRLPPAERNIMIIYAEAGSLREAARVLGCSHQTIAKEIRRIREKIKHL